MVTEEKVQIKAWWELGSEDVPPEAVRALYETLPPKVGQDCEKARKKMGTGYRNYLEGLRDAQLAFGKDGNFKAWCKAYGLNYGTVQNQLSRANSKQANNGKLTARSLVLKFDDDAEQTAMVQRLRDVQAAAGLKPDRWAQTVEYLLNCWDEHKTEAAA